METPDRVIFFLIFDTPLKTATLDIKDGAQRHHNFRHFRHFHYFKNTLPSRHLRPISLTTTGLVSTHSIILKVT